jgi:hypothetical protein
LTQKIVDVNYEQNRKTTGPETIIAGQNLGKSLLAGRREGAQSALEGGVCCAPVVGPVVVPEPGPAGGEEGAPLATTLEHLRAPVVRSHVGPKHRWSVTLAARSRYEFPC